MCWIQFNWVTEAGLNLTAGFRVAEIIRLHSDTKITIYRHYKWLSATCDPNLNQLLVKDFKHHCFFYNTAYFPLFLLWDSYIPL